MMPAITTDSTLAEIRERILAGYPLLVLRTWEEARWEQLLAETVLDLERGLVTWSRTTGWLPAMSSEAEDSKTAEYVLAGLDNYPSDHIFLLKDFHAELSSPTVIRQLRDLVATLPERRQTILLMDPFGEAPLELRKDAIVIPLPLPGYGDLRDSLDKVLTRLREDSPSDEGEEELTPDHENRLIQAVLGLTEAEAVRAWTRALRDRQALDDEAFMKVVSEKRTLAAASDLLEFHDLSAGVDDVGGLDELKEWLRRRSLAYTPKAREQGIPLPRGVLLLGVQGCGKSLTSRVAARMLSFPLIRLDMSRLLESEQGASERNLHNVLQLVESISPAVLWLDELEKGFAGLEGGGSFADATMARIVGAFLMWMQEQTKPVFVVATANSIQNLPPELLRRGRFDELFFIDLPNYGERLQILQIHLMKRGWKPERFRLDELARRSEGFSGAELEQLISTAIIDAFGRGQILNDDDLDRARRNMVPLSKTMEEKIYELRQWAQDRCRRATSDNRAAQMLDEELRMGTLDVPEDEAETASWAALAESGQLKAAIVEYVRTIGEVPFPDLCAALQPHAAAMGDQGLAVRGNPQIILWSGMSPSFCEAIIELVAARRLYVHPAELDVYRSRQKGLRLPILGAPTDERLHRPKWLPSTLRTRPHPQYASKLARLSRIQLTSSNPAE